MRTNIIRIEHPSDGMGLWRSLNTGGWSSKIDRHSQYFKISKRHSNPSVFPGLHEDDELQYEAKDVDICDYHFAFKDLAQLEVALTREELKECIEVLGFQVFMLDVTDYYESSYQIVFKKESIVNKKDISSMFL